MEGELEIFKDSRSRDYIRSTTHKGCGGSEYFIVYVASEKRPTPTQISRSSLAPNWRSFTNSTPRPTREVAFRVVAQVSNSLDIDCLRKQCHLVGGSTGRQRGRCECCPPLPTYLLRRLLPDEEDHSPLSQALPRERRASSVEGLPCRSSVRIQRTL